MNATPTVPAFPLTVPAPPAPAPGDVPMSVDEFLAAYADEPRAELVRGVVRMQPMTNPVHGKVCIRLGRIIDEFVEIHDLGHAMSNDTRIRTGPNSVRGGDVLFFSYARLPRGPLSTALPDVPPDLVAEVRSPSETWVEVFTKVLEYLRSGVRVVVVLDPETRTASVYRPDVLQEILGVGDTLTVSDVLPGFAVPVARLFP